MPLSLAAHDPVAGKPVKLKLSSDPRMVGAVWWTVVVTVMTEAITLYLRWGRNYTALEFNQTSPLLLQIHHMFWSLPLLAVLPLAWRHVRLSAALLGIALGFVLSDLLHHFVVLPLTEGHTGWHWP